jgi:hypothetical protein
MNKTTQLITFICLSLSISTASSMDSEQKRLGDELIRAARKGETKRCKELLTQKADINYRYGGNSSIPLMHAALEGHPECVKMLIDSGANINGKDDYQNTALRYAGNDAFGLTQCIVYPQHMHDGRKQVCKILIETMNTRHHRFLNGQKTIITFLGIGRKKRSRIFSQCIPHDIAQYIAHLCFEAIKKDNINPVEEINMLTIIDQRQWLKYYETLQQNKDASIN